MQRYDIKNHKYNDYEPEVVKDDEGDFCKAEDVNKLEQLNEEMLAVLKGISYQEEYADDYEFIDFEKVKSLIEKSEAMK